MTSEDCGRGWHCGDGREGQGSGEQGGQAQNTATGTLCITISCPFTDTDQARPDLRGLGRVTDHGWQSAPAVAGTLFSTLICSTGKRPKFPKLSN